MEAIIEGLNRKIIIRKMSRFELWQLRKIKRNLFHIDPNTDDNSIFQWLARECTDLIQTEIDKLPSFALWGLYYEILKLSIRDGGLRDGQY